MVFESPWAVLIVGVFELGNPLLLHLSLYSLSVTIASRNVFFDFRTSSFGVGGLAIVYCCQTVSASIGNMLTAPAVQSLFVFHCKFIRFGPFLVALAASFEGRYIDRPHSGTGVLGHLVMPAGAQIRLIHVSGR